MKIKNNKSIYIHETSACLDCNPKQEFNVVMTLDDIMNDTSEPCDKHKGDYNG